MKCMIGYDPPPPARHNRSRHYETRRHHLRNQEAGMITIMTPSEEIQQLNGFADGLEKTLLIIRPVQMIPGSGDLSAYLHFCEMRSDCLKARNALWAGRRHTGQQASWLK